MSLTREKSGRAAQRKQHLIDETHAAVFPTAERLWYLLTVTQIGGDNKSCCCEEQIDCHYDLDNKQLKYGQYMEVY